MVFLLAQASFFVPSQKQTFFPLRQRNKQFSPSVYKPTFLSVV